MIHTKLIFCWLKFKFVWKPSKEPITIFPWICRQLYNLRYMIYLTSYSHNLNWISSLLDHNNFALIFFHILFHWIFVHLPKCLTSQHNHKTLTFPGIFVLSTKYLNFMQFLLIRFVICYRAQVLPFAIWINSKVRIICV